MSPAENFKFSTESKQFWDETTDLLKNLARLHQEVEDISCPCHKADCPFSSKTFSQKKHSTLEQHFSNKSLTVQRNLSPPTRRNGVANGYLSHSAQHQVATYLASMHHNDAYISNRDCEITEEPLGGDRTCMFVRSSPFRRARRKHTSLRLSASYPTTMNNLTVPCLRGSHSLSSGLGGSLSSIDIMDSDRLQDIKRSHLKAYSSSSELMHW